MLVHGVMDLILGEPEPNARGEVGRRRVWFPGGQPVSLEGSNLDLLSKRRCVLVLVLVCVCVCEC